MFSCRYIIDDGPVYPNPLAFICEIRFSLQAYS